MEPHERAELDVDGGGGRRVLRIGHVKRAVLAVFVEGEDEVVRPVHLERKTAVGVGRGGISPGFHTAFVLGQAGGLALAGVDRQLFDPLNLRQGDAVGTPERRDLDLGGGPALRIEHAAVQHPRLGRGENGAGDNEQTTRQQPNASQHGDSPAKPERGALRTRFRRRSVIQRRNGAGVLFRKSVRQTGDGTTRRKLFLINDL